MARWIMFCEKHEQNDDDKWHACCLPHGRQQNQLCIMLKSGRMERAGFKKNLMTINMK